MSWQEEELRKRREQQVTHDEIRSMSSICTRRIAELWDNLLAANSALPAELRMPLATDRFRVQHLAGMGNCDLEYDVIVGKLAYRKIKSVCGVGTMCEEYIVHYDSDNDILLFQYANGPSTLPIVPISVESLPTIIRNLCTGRHVVAGLVQEDSTISEQTRAGWKYFGII